MLVTQCPTLCDPMDCSPPGSSVHEISQARILEWVAISFSRGSSQPRDRTRVSCTAGRFFTDWATREALESESESEVAQSNGLYPTRLLCPWDSPGKNTEVGHSGMFFAVWGSSLLLLSTNSSIHPHFLSISQDSSILSCQLILQTADRSTQPYLSLESRDLSCHMCWECFFKNIHSFIWLHQVLVLGCGIFSCDMWHLVPSQGSNLGPLHWEWGVLATGPPGQSLCWKCLITSNYFLILLNLNLNLKF